MLQGVETQIGQIGCLWVPIDTEDAALVSEFVQLLAHNLTIPNALLSDKRQ
jgi:hypothetical protein